jgi:hypothetical protein
MVRVTRVRAPEHPGDPALGNDPHRCPATFRASQQADTFVFSLLSQPRDRMATTVACCFPLSGIALVER